MRLKQQVLNAYSSVGALLTRRLGSNGEDKIAYGVDARLRPFRDEYVTVKSAQTFDEAVKIHAHVGLVVVHEYVPGNVATAVPTCGGLR